MGNRIVIFDGCNPKARNVVANLLASPCLCQRMSDDDATLHRI